jgi:hypothetical protein
MRFNPHTDPGAAINALAAIVRSKTRRGYGVRQYPATVILTGCKAAGSPP